MSKINFWYERGDKQSRVVLFWLMKICVWVVNSNKNMNYGKKIVEDGIYGFIITTNSGINSFGFFRLALSM